MVLETSPAYMLAWQYLKSTRQSNSITFMTRLCFIGVFVGTFALMMTLIVMSGFERAVSVKMQSVNPDVVITAGAGKLDYSDMKRVLLERHGDVVEAVGGGSTRQVILCGDDAQSIIFLNGVDSSSEVTKIDDKILPVDGKRERLEGLVGFNEIVLGYKLADSLGIKDGDMVELLVPESGAKHKILLDSRDIKISGRIKVGLEEYDSTMAYCSLETLHDLFDEDGVDRLEVKLRKQDLSFWDRLRSYVPGLGIDHGERMVDGLQRALPKLMVQSWKELYPSLLASLRLEKYVMFLLLLLITLVASMNMVSLLFMQVQARRGDIAILKTIGMPSDQIRKIFIMLGLTITLSSSLLGLLLAFITGLFLKHFPIITLPDVYYVSHLPVYLAPGQFMFVFVLTLVISLIATWTPARMAQRVHITSVLRQE